jgi:hypothetical protein
LIQYKTYNTGATQFESLYVACGKDWKRFLGALQSLKSEVFLKPQQQDLELVLKPLVEYGCRTGQPG